ncbi:hypothetical protein AMS68_003992 [Peltaster fructicola]|uniref:Amidase domain-containing protein n=1 Tax=Peltaster fructicola TaxID=286661 RepID=A0A6H0XUZ3_9PEZI|nr:hypothetical protein AMS68_003992 [Peltaster fructicola]
MAATEEWKAISERAKAKLDDSIPPEWRLKPDMLPSEEGLNVTDIPFRSAILTEHEIVITNSSAIDIVINISHGTWKSVDVTRAFCKRASIAHQLTRCLTVTMFDSALKHAKELDDYYRENGHTIGPLHGLPVSLKDNFNIPGYPSSVGFCAWAEEPVQEESTIVAMLKDLGAVAYVKTNIPTAMMIAESVNNCYGRTVNPLNTSLTSGGSSGGESALITMHGSPLGVGTDIGGSLRIPAACTGIFTLRPSQGRFPNFDARSGMTGQEAVGSVHGPMAHSIADLRLYAQTICNAGPWLKDPKCLAIPWRDGQLKQKLKIGVLWNDGVCMPTPPVTRALKEVVEQLKKKGYEVIEWSPDGHALATELLLKFFTADGGKSMKKILDQCGEPFRPEMKGYETAQDLGVHELWQLQDQRTKFAKMYLDRWAQSAGMDAILSPTTPYAAPKNGEFKWIGYTGIWNILDYSAVSFPTGLYANKELDHAVAGYQALNQYDTAQADYDAAAVHGMPVSLQLIAKRLQEEKILDIAERVVSDLTWS